MEKEVHFMPMKFKIDVLEALKAKGYTTYTLRKENILSQSTLQKLREGKGLSWENIERICGLLECQPGDLIEYVQENN
jgi:putative transcriptional regulator